MTFGMAETAINRKLNMILTTRSVTILSIHAL